MVISTILSTLVIIALFVALGWFHNWTQDRSRQRFADNNRAGTLRTGPYLRSDRHATAHAETDDEY